MLTFDYYQLPRTTLEKNYYLGISKTKHSVNGLFFFFFYKNTNIL